MEGLLLEWSKLRPLLDNKKIISIYFGGGTPFLLGPHNIKRLLDLFTYDNTAEITLEANPENISREAMVSFFEAGINRVSIGIQTLDSALLNKIGRLHDADRAKQAVYDTLNGGINNISIDLMYDLPGQTLDSWIYTLDEALKLPIQHLSLYNLTIEPHTVFFKYRSDIEQQLPTEETSLQMLLEAEKRIEQSGLSRYEISAFARPEAHSRHNSGYWTGRPFLGLGPSAFSFWEGARYRNIAHLGRYLEKLKKEESPVDFSETLPSDEQKSELVALKLRFIAGIGENDPLLTPQIIKSLEQLTQEPEPLLCLHEGRYRLTNKGKLFYDRVASEII